MDCSTTSRCIRSTRPAASWAEIQTVTAYQVQGGSVPSGGPIIAMLEFVSGTLAVLDLNTATPYFQMRTTITGSAGTSVDVLDLDLVTYLQRPEDTEHRRVAPAEPKLGSYTR